MTASILFVCLGNICRSPTAEAVFQSRLKAVGLANQIQVDSAGTGDWHVGAAPDTRAQAAGLARGYDLSHLRARQVSQEDFFQHRWIIAMDQNNLRDLIQLAPAVHTAQLNLLLDYSSLSLVDKNVPDPYYGKIADFDRMLDLIEDACQGLLVHIHREII